MLAAMAPLMALGIRSPLQMLPILLYELFWKSIWLVAIALPLWLGHRIDPDTAETVKACLFGVVIVPLVIPWPYVFANYIKRPGDRWKPRAATAGQRSSASAFASNSRTS
jgi:hypothetical protein